MRKYPSKPEKSAVIRVKYKISLLCFLPFLLITSFACQKSATSGGVDGGCGVAVEDTFVESLDKKANEAALVNAESKALEISAHFEKTIPSGLEWSLKNGELVLGEEQYTLDYTEDNFWNLFDKDGNLKGSLTPFRTESCDRVSKFELLMFSPEEKASAFLSYLSL